MASIIASSILALAGLGFGVTDVAGKAEPTRIARDLGWGLLEAKIYCSGARKRPSFAPLGADLTGSRGRYPQGGAGRQGAGNGQADPVARSLSPRPPQFAFPLIQVPIAMDAHLIQHGIPWTGRPALGARPANHAWRLGHFVNSLGRPGKEQGTASTSEDPLASLRPYLVGLSVPNARSAARWYEEKLGFEQRGESHEPDGTFSIVIERGPVAIELLQIRDSYSIAKYAKAYRPTSFRLQGIVKLGFAVDDLDSVLTELVARNVPILQKITELKQFRLRFLLIQDNNGNVIQLFDHKGFEK